MSEDKHKTFSTKDVMFVWMFIITIGAVIFAIYTFNNFRTEKAEEPALQVTTTSTSFYTNAVTNVRSCPSISCDPVGTFTINHEISLPYEEYGDLPEWIEISPKDTNGSDTGYIHKSTLGISQVETPIPSSVSTETKPTVVQDAEVDAEMLANKALCESYREQEQLKANSEMPLYTVAIHRIFYSPTRNSCIVMKFKLNGNGAEGQLLEIADILDGTTIWSQYYPQTMKYWEAHAILDNQAKLLELE